MFPLHSLQALARLCAQRCNKPDKLVPSLGSPRKISCSTSSKTSDWFQQRATVSNQLLGCFLLSTRSAFLTSCFHLTSQSELRLLPTRCCCPCLASKPAEPQGSSVSNSTCHVLQGSERLPSSAVLSFPPKSPTLSLQ